MPAEPSSWLNDKSPSGASFSFTLIELVQQMHCHFASNTMEQQQTGFLRRVSVLRLGYKAVANWIMSQNVAKARQLDQWCAASKKQKPIVSTNSLGQNQNTRKRHTLWAPLHHARQHYYMMHMIHITECASIASYARGMHIILPLRNDIDSRLPP